MAPLPHFSLPSYSYTNIEPVYNFCEIDFGVKILKEVENNITKVSKNSIYFNLNLNIGGKVEVLDFILPSIDNKEVFKLVEFKFTNKNGNISYRIIVENFRFTKVVNLLDFDYSKYELKNLKVKFKYDKSHLIYEKDYTKFIRRLKLDNINI